MPKTGLKNQKKAKQLENKSIAAEKN